MLTQNSTQNNQKTIGVILANIGSPDAPTPKAVRKFLAQFLSDPRIIDWPRWIWLPVLYGIILLVRPKRSACLYQNIWDNGSPLTKILIEQTAQLNRLFVKNEANNFTFAVGMRYGTPSIVDALKKFRNQKVDKLIILPLFPQFSSTTTRSIYDAVIEEINSWTWVPEIQLLSDYHAHPAYINELAETILEARKTNAKPEKLLFSFHGVPKRYLEQSDDPYQDQCFKTASMVADKCNLEDSEWDISFQSKFGPEEWLTPSTENTLAKWGNENLKSVHVICPGFSADCLETIDEIDREAREIYQDAGGKNFYYIPALNNRAGHIKAIARIILQDNQILENQTISPDFLSQSP